MSLFSVPFFGKSKKSTLPKKTNKKISLRPYQIETINTAIDALVIKGLSFLICLPAQTGKTFTLFGLISKINLVTLFVTPRRFITEQGANEALEFFRSDEVGYITSSTKDISNELIGKKVIVCDLETIINRIEIEPSIFRYIQMLAIDEAHYKAKRADRIRELLSHAYHIGITATPYNGKGEKIGGWEFVLNKFTTRYMVENKFLSHLELYHADIYAQKDKYERYLNECRNNKMSEKGLSKEISDIGHIVTKQIISHNIKTGIVNKKDRALVYAGSIEQSEMIVEEYKKNGINAVCVHSKVKDTSSIINGFNNGEFNVLVSVSMLIMGVVIKNVKVSVFFRDIGSYVTFIQISNRGRGGSPEMTAIPNKQYHYTRTLTKLGNPDLFEPHEKGEAEVKKLPHCKKCNSVFADFPPIAIKESLNKGFYSITKECIVCGNQTESEGFTSQKQPYEGVLNLMPLEEQARVHKKVAKAKVINQIDSIIYDIRVELEGKNVKQWQYLVNYFIDNKIKLARLDNMIFSKILRLCKSERDGLEIQRKIKKYLIV